VVSSPNPIFVSLFFSLSFWASALPEEVIELRRYEKEGDRHAWQGRTSVKIDTKYYLSTARVEIFDYFYGNPCKARRSPYLCTD